MSSSKCIKKRSGPNYNRISKWDSRSNCNIVILGKVKNKQYSHDHISNGCSINHYDSYRKTAQFMVKRDYSLNLNVSKRRKYVIGKDVRNIVKPFSVTHNSRKINLSSLVNTNQTFVENGTENCVALPLENLKRTLFERLNSFRNWPRSSTVPTSSLVEAGFVHKHGEHCVCAWCDIVIDASSLNGKRPLDVHREKNPSCEYIINYRSNTLLDSELPNPFNKYTVSSNGRRQTNNTQCDSFSGGLSACDSTRGLQYDAQQGRATNDVTEDRPVPVIATPTYSPRNPAMVTEQARRETFMYWPHTALVDTGYIAEAGFFCIGTDDTVRCFYCDIGLADWSNEDDPWVEHARFNPDCPFLRQKKPREFIENIQREWAQTYSPKHPEMSDLQDRMRTFVNSSWPSDMVTQNPQQIAMAGFYYIGEGDTVRCHYCDGGLREWEPGDDPWIEHARWFPFCKYVLRTKGQGFIRMCSIEVPNDTASAAAPNPPPSVPQATVPVVSYADECRKKEKKNPMYSAAAESVRGMGYSKAVLKSVINEYISKTGRRTFTAQDLMAIIFAREEKGAELSLYEGEEEQFEIGGGSSEDEEMELSLEAYEKEIEYLQDRLICVDCKTRERSTVFLPCGHRIMCDVCSRRTDTCTSCGSAIDRRIKTFLS